MECRICDQSSSFRSIYAFETHPSKVIQCGKCEVLRLDPFDLSKGLHDDYEGFGQGEGFLQYMKTLREPQYREDLKILSRLQPEGSILDIGSSYGFFLHLAQQQGYEVAGVEPSESAFSLSQQQYPDLAVRQGMFADNREDFSKTYDIVTLWSVLEHTLDPAQVMEDVNRVLKPKGILAIRVPDYDGILARLIILLSKLTFRRFEGPMRSLYQMDYAYKHFYHFNEKSLSQLLKNKGYQLEHVYRENSIRSDLLDNRVSASQEVGDLKFAQNPVVRWGVKFLLAAANFFGRQDEIVVFARRVI